MKWDTRASRTRIRIDGYWIKGHAHPGNTVLRMSENCIARLSALTDRVAVGIDANRIVLRPSKSGKKLNIKNRSITCTAAAAVIGDRIWIGKPLRGGGISFSPKEESA